MNWWKLSLLAVTLVAVGCDSDNDEISIEQAPLGVIFSLPSEAIVPSPPYTGTENLSVTFNRATGLGEMQLSLYPPALTGDITTQPDSRRTWTWHDVEFDEALGCYFWMIDGVRLGRWANLDDERIFERRPVIVTIPSAMERRYAVGFAGTVTSTNSNVIASGTVIFALPSDSSFNPLDPAGTFDQNEAIGIVLAQRDDDFLDLSAPYRATYLPVDEQILVVAIQDTNEDMYYSPADDWWGTYEIDGEFAAVFSRLDTGEKDNPFDFGVAVFLGPPVGAGQ